MTRCIALLMSLALAGCVSSTAHLNSVSIGMTKPEVVKAMGPPTSTRGNSNVEYLMYHLASQPWITRAYAARSGVSGYGEDDYYVRLTDGRVDSYGRQGDFDSTKIPEAKVDVDLNTQSAAPNNNQPTQTRTVMQQGMDALERKDYGTALTEFKIETAANPSSTDAWYGIGSVHLDLGEYEDSLPAFKHVLEIDPKQPSAWLGIAGAYYHLQQFDKYQDAISQLRRLNPKLADEADRVIRQPTSNSTPTPATP